jgi:hypothetical protein
MIMLKHSLFGGGVVASLLCVTVAHATVIVIDFDHVTAPPFYVDVTPGGALGPQLVFPEVTLDGGVILSNGGWDNWSTSGSNIYATGETSKLADGSMLPGIITGIFASTAKAIELDISNGFGVGDFTLTAYNANNQVVDSDTVSLAGFTTPGYTGSLAVAGEHITWFTVTSSQLEGSKNFAIDTLMFTIQKVPAPGALALFGLAGLCSVRRRR